MKKSLLPGTLTALSMSKMSEQDGIKIEIITKNDWKKKRFVGGDVGGIPCCYYIVFASTKLCVLGFATICGYKSLPSHEVELNFAISSTKPNNKL